MPRRGPVLGAKVVAAILLGTAATLVAVAVTAAGVLGGAALTGETADWTGSGDAVTSAVLINVLNLLMAVGLGALAGSTAVGLVAYYALPTGWAIAGPAVFGRHAEWLDVFDAFSQIAVQEVTTSTPKMAVALTVWVVLPLVAGVVVSLRREVK